MEKLDDRCTTTKTASASDASRGKTAAGIAVYLLEELGDARLRCAQLKKYVAEAQQLVEKSTHRDHFMEVAAHLIQGIPDALFRLEKALDAAAMSAARMDYEEIKQNLKPEKVEELDTVLQDARVRYLTRRSDAVPVRDTKTAAEEITRIAAVADATGAIPVDDMMMLIATLERGARTASAGVRASDRLRGIAKGLFTAKSGEVSRVTLAKTLRTFLADVVQPTASQTAVALMQQAGSREEVMKGFKEANPDLSKEQLEEIADQWEKNKNVVKDKSAAKQAAHPWEATHGLDRLARFEEGKPADPTENMSPADAKKWHEENDKHKDDFKSAGEKLSSALTTLSYGSKLLDVNPPAAMMLLASGVGTMSTALMSCGLPVEGHLLRRTADTLTKSAKSATEVAISSLTASSREEVMRGFKEANPDLTDAQLEEIADQWEKNQNVVKDKHQG